MATPTTGPSAAAPETSLETGTYEIIRRRLLGHAETLRDRLDTLNTRRKEVFGAVETQLIATGRITTTHNCLPAGMVAIGDHFLFGYNVHIGLRTGIHLADVFSYYRFDSHDHSFHEATLDHILGDATFREDFQNLYKYYKDTTFDRFAVVGPHLYLVFRVGKSVRDIKTFKWARHDDGLTYLGNRFDHEVRYPDQHEFAWQRATRDMQRRGTHPHIAILDRVFVETIGGDLTIKVEDNTDSGQGIYAEPVDYPDQTLDDAEYYYAGLGNLIVLKIRPYQEKAFRYLIFNEKMREVLRVDALEHACVLLPDDQGLIFANGYYLQTGIYKLFDNIPPGLQFEKRISAANGEDFLFVFHSPESGTYALLPYNLVAQQVDTPIICQGYSIFPDGALCYFRREAEPGRHHVIQVWQTPYGSNPPAEGRAGDWLYKVGNQDLVRGMAECRALLTLLDKEDAYANLYVDLVKKTSDILDAYFWIGRPEAGQLAEPLTDIRTAAASAIDEYEKVRSLRTQTQAALAQAEATTTQLLDRLRRHKPQRIDQYVDYLAQLRQRRGEVIGLRDLRYVDLPTVAALEDKLVAQTEALSHACVQFLLDPASLAPYEAQIVALQGEAGTVAKVSEADAVATRLDETAGQLQLLIDTVGNLRIEDATETTRIIDQVSALFAQLNSLRASLKRRRQELRSGEAQAEFQAQVKLLEQTVTNYLDLCDTPQATETYLTRLMVQVEELEGKFAGYDDFILALAGKRDEVYQAFESRRLQLVEARNQRADSLLRAGERILKGIANRLDRFTDLTEIHAYFAGDLMVAKVRDLIAQLEGLQDTVKAADLQSRLKTLREDAARQLRDRQDLFTEGEDVIRLGRHHFSVNRQPLDLTLIPREDQMYAHLTGTNFFLPLEDADFQATRPVWGQALPSENAEVYRAEYLAYQLWQAGGPADEAAIRAAMAARYQEGYVKGVHDADTLAILQALLDLDGKLGLLRFAPAARACAQLFWMGFIEGEARKLLHSRLKGAGHLRRGFPGPGAFASLQASIAAQMTACPELWAHFPAEIAPAAAAYLLEELSQHDSFVISGEAAALYTGFGAQLKARQVERDFRRALEELTHAPSARYALICDGLTAYAAEAGAPAPGLIAEAAALLFGDSYNAGQVRKVAQTRTLSGLRGEHARIGEGGAYTLDYHDFVARLQHFEGEVRPRYAHFQALKQQRLEALRQSLRLEEFQPRVLSSFVRNQLIDQVYLPRFGDNFAKQIGTVGEQTRTDRQGLLLLISPPGYGKTTLMEYLANRLGLVFMKINGPAIGHEVRALDPGAAPNAAAREELHKLNLALEMGDNIMLYLDDIQHCHPEFLQKFISLCDAQRRIEGMFRGQPRTYDLRGRRVAVVMAGNPYTESGEKFRIPDMLANRADTYNLGDIVGDNRESFERSYLENSLTANPILARLASRPPADIYALFRAAETGEAEGLTFESAISAEEASEYLAVLRHLLRVRDVILRVNLAYIQSAGQQDAYRTEPPFLLQGSYRNMNRLAEQVVPVMNAAELDGLIRSHYEREAQTLTTGAEANLLKFKQLNGYAAPADEARWAEICRIYREEKTLQADRLAQLVQQMGAFSEGLLAIRDVLAGREEP